MYTNAMTRLLYPTEHQSPETHLPRKLEAVPLDCRRSFGVLEVDIALHDADVHLSMSEEGQVS